jgi:hypothetical protein
MKTEMVCPVCQKKRTENGETAYVSFPAQIRSDSTSLLRCPEGHRILHVIQDGGFGRLFERGLERLARESPRDAVMDVYTAFEMYLSHVVVRALFDRPSNTQKPAEIRSRLKHALQTSDKAGAAALATYASIASGELPVFKSDLSSIRNNAVHQGFYPSVGDVEVSVHRPA